MRIGVLSRPVLHCHRGRSVRFVTYADRECIPKSEQFYEEENKHRRYYYVMDLRGQLFIENTVRNIATSMKDKKFLDFMYRNLKPNDSGFAHHIPYVTYCGKEMNFVTPMDTNAAIVYKDFTPPSHESDTFKLHFGGTLTQDFDPNLLVFCNENGRFYHRLTNHKYLTVSERVYYGLLNVDITTQYISDNLVFESSDPATKKEDQPEKLRLRWNGRQGVDTLFDIGLI